jgi:serine/threonine protein kinase
MVGDVVKIGDFGVAKELGKRSPCSDSHMTPLSNMVKLLDVNSVDDEADPGHDFGSYHDDSALHSSEAGTTVYADPEQLKGRQCSSKVGI